MGGMSLCGLGGNRWGILRIHSWTDRVLGDTPRIFIVIIFQRILIVWMITILVMVVKDMTHQRQRITNPE